MKNRIRTQVSLSPDVHEIIGKYTSQHGRTSFIEKLIRDYDHDTRVEPARVLMEERMDKLEARMNILTGEQ